MWGVNSNFDNTKKIQRETDTWTGSGKAFYTLDCELVMVL